MRRPLTWARIWAFTNPSSVATHSLVTGTSFCVTSTNSTGGGADAACCFVSHPANQTMVAKRGQVNLRRFAFMMHPPEKAQRFGPELRVQGRKTQNLTPHACGRINDLEALAGGY